MSLLLHLCRTCGHKETSHEGRDRGYSECGCCRSAGDIDPEPVLVQTFRCPGGGREPLYPPGAVWNSGTTHRMELCACGRCEAAAERLGGGTAVRPTG